MKKEITAEERADLIHKWKCLQSAGDIGEAAIIAKTLRDNPAPLSPEDQAIVNRMKAMPNIPVKVEQEEEIAGAIKSKPKKTGNRGRPKGSKNKAKK
jgi:hypothetical protein